MKHLQIIIDIPVDDEGCPLQKHEAEEAAKQAYQAARKSLYQFTRYDVNDFEYKIEV